MGKCVSKQPNESDKEKSRLTLSTDPDESIPEIMNAKTLKKILNNEDKTLISTALKKQYLFCSLGESEMEIVYYSLKHYTVEKDSIIFEQGSAGKKFYIIESGKIEVYRNSVKKAILGRGDTFGEMALLTNQARRATLKTTEVTTLWGIGRPQFKAALEIIYSKNYPINREFISNLQLFAGLSENDKDLLTKSAIQHEYADNTRIICEGDEGNLLFIIKEGAAIAKIQGVEQSRLFKGDMFGESVVMGNNQIRNCSIFAVGRVQCLSIDKDSIVSIIGENYKEIIYKSQANYSLSSDKLLGMLQKGQIIAIVNEMEWKNFAKGDVVIPSKGKTSRIYVLCTGKARISEAVFGANHVFGLGNANQKAILNENLIAETDVTIGLCKRRAIEMITKSEFKSLKFQLKITRFLRKISITSIFDQSKIHYLAAKASIVEFDAKEIIYRHNDDADCFYVIRRGAVEIFFDGKLLRVLGKYDVFGESCLEEEQRPRTARAQMSTECVMIPVNEYRILMDQQVLPRLGTRKSLFVVFNLNQLLLIQKVSCEGYKSVYLATLSGTNPTFQVTVIDKKLIDTVEKCNFIVQEKTIAMCSEHHLLMKFVKSFVDKRFVFIAYDYIPYQNFASVFKGPVNEDIAKFTAACLVQVLDYFHSKSIVYRDLCPDNILVKSNGYIMLYNFWSAKVVKGRTNTIIGNTFYSAPEMLLGKGYTKSLDYWNLGVLIFELLYGFFPFDIKKSDTPLEIADKIIKNALQFPPDSKLIKANEFISILLIKDPRERAKIKEIKYSKWMSSVDMSRISSEEDIAPFKPNIPKFVRRNSKTIETMSLQRYVNVIFIQESVGGDELKPLVKFNWERYF